MCRRTSPKKAGRASPVVHSGKSRTACPHPALDWQQNNACRVRPVAETSIGKLTYACHVPPTAIGLLVMIFFGMASSSEEDVYIPGVGVSETSDPLQMGCVESAFNSPFVLTRLFPDAIAFGKSLDFFNNVRQRRPSGWLRTVALLSKVFRDPETRSGLSGYQSGRRVRRHRRPSSRR